MHFYIPTRIFIEKNCISNHRQELCALGNRAFIVTGQHSAMENGSLADIISVLDDAKITYSVFSEIEENPSVETVVEGAERGKSFCADFVIGIGGGSPMDAAKAIALMINNPQENADCLYQNKLLSALPVVTVPTTCGTGSEATAVSVLTLHASATKKSISHKIFPVLSLIDCRYLHAASPTLLINTSIDALAHCLESYLNSSADIYNRMFSGYGLKLWGEVRQYLFALENISDEILEKFMLTSTIAGMAIAHTGTSLPHAMSYEITYAFHTPHGKACGIFLPAYLREYEKNNPQDIRQVLTLLGYDSIDSFENDIHKLLGKVTIPHNMAEQLIHTMSENSGKLNTFPYSITGEDLDRMYRQALILTDENVTQN